MRNTRGTETSKYPQEEKTNVIPQVVASERGRAQTVLPKGNAGYGPIKLILKELKSVGKPASQRVKIP